MANFEFVKTMAGGNEPPITVKLPVAATQTIVKGDALIWSSGKLAKGSTGFDQCVGIAAQDSASAAAGTLIEVEIVLPHHVYRAVASAAATAIVRDGTRSYDLTSAQLVNIADTTGGSIQAIDIDPDDATIIYVQFTSCYYG